MTAQALDVTPIVDQLVADPFDRTRWQRAESSLGDKMVYARALRAAAKRAPDARAAAHFLVEASRVHESLDDPGGALALLTRAWDCDPRGGGPVRERVAKLLALVGARVGLGVTVSLSDGADCAPFSERRVVSESTPGSARPSETYDPFRAARSPSSVYADEPADDDRFVDDVLRELNRARMSRPKGDRLLGGVFEAMHTLRFIDDIRDGAGFVLRVVVDKTRARTGLVHLYDPERRDFVVAGVIGAPEEALLEFRTTGDDPFIGEIVNEREAIIVVDPKSDPALHQGRWAVARPQRSVLCAAASRHGQTLGLIEIADPVDGSEFSEDDRNALTYVATAFAEFLEHRSAGSASDHPDFDSDARATRPEVPVSVPSNP